MKDFYTRFDNLRSQIPKEVCPSNATAVLLYLNAFEGQFNFILKERMPNNLAKEREYSAQIDEHIIN